MRGRPLHLVCKLCVATAISAPFLFTVSSLSQFQHHQVEQSRRKAILQTLSAASSVIASTAAPALWNISPCSAATVTGPDRINNVNDELVTKLSKRDPSVLKNSIFNVPPDAQIYPMWMRGDWQLTLKFSGFSFPSKSIPNGKIFGDVSIPGFQKCSIVAIADVGRAFTSFPIKISTETGLEDRVYNVARSIDAHLGYDAVTSVIYDAANTPNRLSIDFQKTRNAERIELFCNAREASLVRNNNSSSEPNNLSTFICSEYYRQVTFSLSQEFGIARQVIGNHAQFWTWNEQEDGTTMSGNLLTTAYLNPQSPMYFDEPEMPVAVYYHEIIAKRI